jgi:mRNA interferase RelE/StbE
LKESREGLVPVQFRAGPEEGQGPAILAAVKHAIEQIEQATSLSDIDQFRKLSGAAGYYRIGVGDYRLGLADCGGGLECVRCLHRRDI